MASIEVTNITSTSFRVRLIGLQVGIAQGITYDRRCNWGVYDADSNLVKSYSMTIYSTSTSTESDYYTFRDLSSGSQYTVYCSIYGDTDNDGKQEELITLGYGPFWTNSGGSTGDTWFVEDIYFGDSIDANNEMEMPLVSYQMYRVSVSFATAGTALFYTTGDVDTYGFLTTSSDWIQGSDRPASTIIAENDDGESGESGNNFLITQDVEANTEYYIWVRGYDKTKEGTIWLHIDLKESSSSGLTCYDYTSYVSGDNFVNTLCFDMPSDYTMYFKAVSDGYESEVTTRGGGETKSEATLFVPLEYGYGKSYEVWYGQGTYTQPPTQWKYYTNIKTCPPPLTIKNVTVKNWLVSIDWEYDDSLVSEDMGYNNMYCYLYSNFTNYLLGREENISSASGLSTFDFISSNRQEKTGTLVAYNYIYVDVDGTEYEVQSAKTYIYRLTIPQEVTEFSWSQAASEAFNNHGYTTQLTFSEWNQFVEFVATKTPGYDVSAAFMTADDKVMTADRFNIVRYAIGSTVTGGFRDGDNSIKEYIEQHRPTIDDVDAWNMLPGEVVKGRYFIDLATYANKI